VDELALTQALREKRIAAAGLDVFQNEPVPADSTLLQLENTVLAPHIAGFTSQSIDGVNDTLIEELTRIVRGETPRNLVNRSQLMAAGHLH
jgi:phosphogluconate 2-dehydrogenase